MASEAKEKTKTKMELLSVFQINSLLRRAQLVSIYCIFSSFSSKQNNDFVDPGDVRVPPPQCGVP